MELKKELNFIGHNFNQSVRLLNTFKDTPSATAFVKKYEADREAIFNKVEHVEARIHQIADLWLQ
jgi:iron uptake system EfeUOB component EfeO/EfeM